VLPWPALEMQLERLQHALTTQDIEQIRLLLSELVSGYVPSEQIVDWVVLANHTPPVSHAQTPSS
jgi:hypothetical protein